MSVSVHVFQYLFQIKLFLSLAFFFLVQVTAYSREIIINFQST